MELTKKEVKTIIEALEELSIYREQDEEPRTMTVKGLYDDEARVLTKLTV
jgi:predicted RNA-binding protein YlqC (UPF0109 family)